MTRFYDLDDANATVAELDGILAVLAEQRAELVRLRDEVLAGGAGGGDGAPTAVAERPLGSPDGPHVDDLRLTRLRMQGLIDQMAAGVARIDALGLTLRDIEHGLVDIPALVSGRQVWLCWQLGAPPAGGARVTERSVVVGRDGRAKAYRPLPEAQRAAALAAGLASYERGDFFEAHEELEPAWMASPDLAERALLQGLIKVAAAYVHDARGNPPGIARNLEGARVRLVEARSTGPAGNPAAIDIDALIAAIDLRLADLADHPDGPTLGPPELRRRLP